MMKNGKRRTAVIVIGCVGVLALLLLSTEARADRRSFPYTYGYMTLPKGGFEVEHYLDAEIARFDNPATALEEDDVGVSWRHQIELEYGITDRLDLGLYNVFEQKEHGDFEYKGVKLRSRYRFGDEGEWVVDPALYLELVIYRDKVKLEEMLILAKHLGDVELAFNFKVEQGWKIEGEDEFALELIPSLGAGYHFTSWLVAGIGYVAKVEFEGGEASHAHFAGPSLSLTGGRFWWSIAFQPEFASSEGTRLRFQARSLIGIIL